MQNINIGDIVARKSYGLDILFKVVAKEEIDNKTNYLLKGICYRLEADALENDLILQSREKVNEYTRNTLVQAKNCLRTNRRQRKRFINSSRQNFITNCKILHVDGDESYLKLCLEQYKKHNLNAVGVYVPEKDQPNEILRLLKKHKPDILILTGHDGVIKSKNGYSDMSNYRTSKYFVESVKVAREYEKNMDDLVIFAGACQSMYINIIKAGANFASSPFRVLIHALDPVFICKLIATSSVDKIISPEEIINATITGQKGIGGIQTRGKKRYGYPIDNFSPLGS